jgi:uncharacterized membrane protein
MVVRQARLTALLLLATIVALAAWSLLHFGPGHLLPARRPGGAPEPAWHTALLYPGAALLWTFVCETAARLRRWRRNVARAGNVFASAWVGTMTLILAGQAIVLAGGLGYQVDRNAALAAVVGLILLYRANLLPKSRPAWFNGVALPIFAGNSDVWRRVHRASAYRLIAIALLALFLAAIRPAGVDPMRPILILLLAELVIASGHGLWLGRTLH